MRLHKIHPTRSDQETSIKNEEKALRKGQRTIPRLIKNKDEISQLSINQSQGSVAESQSTILRNIRLITK